jgi:TM2 domain-containing membrane protein YozV
LADWYYIGHYGQLGPLTRDQVDELIDGGVIEQDTYVWCTGMANWSPALHVDDLRPLLQSDLLSKPPPLPSLRPIPSKPTTPPVFGMQSAAPSAGTDFFPNPYAAYHPSYVTVRSDRNRLVAGLLQLLIPGTGRMYLGYAAHGVLQLLLVPCVGVGWLWSVIDGILILAGGLKLDGYGRKLDD